MVECIPNCNVNKLQKTENIYYDKDIEYYIFICENCKKYYVKTGCFIWNEVKFNNKKQKFELA